MKALDSKAIGHVVGVALAVIVFGCLAACIAGSVIAVTLKFLSWIF